MIISHKYKFIFIKTMKTAGTSIEVFLSDICGSEDILTPIIPQVDSHKARNYEQYGFYNHISGNQIKKKISAGIWCSYYKFCFERNPWDKVLSHYYMTNARSKNGVTFDRYFNDRKFPIDYDKYIDTDGKIIVDNIFRYESLNSDLSYVFDLLAIPFNGELGVKEKSGYRIDKRHYREILSKNQENIIRNLFSKEIELFDYEF